MRFFKSIAAAVMLMSLPAAAVAQSDAAKSESEARAILNEMSQAAKACSTIEVSFTATYANKRTGDKHASDGSLKVKGDAYVLDVNGMVTYSDGKTVYVWQKEANEVDISDCDPDAEGEMTPTKLFGAYKTGYKLRRLPDAALSGVNCSQVDLYPVDKKTDVMRLRISVEKATMRIRQFEQSTKTGESLTITVKDFKVNKPMPDSAFKFDIGAHKGVEVVDLR